MTTYAKHRFHILDGMRGIAAIIIMTYHYYMHAGSYHPMLENPYIAVDFFFILSGFVIMHSYGDRLVQGMSILAYIGRRLIRLYPLMAVSIIIGGPLFYLYTSLGLSTYSKRDILSGVFANLFFIPFFNDKQVFYTGTPVVGRLFPTDSPLWSIFFEMVASIVFIFMAKASRPFLLKFCIASLAALFIACLFSGFVDYSQGLETGGGWSTGGFLSGFPRVLYGFSCGVLLYKIYVTRSEESSRQKLADIKVLLLYTVLTGCLLFPYKFYGIYYFVSIALIAPALVWYGSRIRHASPATLKTAEFLGWLSYPIYCLHSPIWFGFTVLEEKMHISNLTGLSSEIMAMGTTIILAVILTKFFDEPVRNWLSRKLNAALKNNQ